MSKSKRCYDVGSRSVADIEEGAAGIKYCTSLMTAIKAKLVETSGNEGKALINRCIKLHGQIANAQASGHGADVSLLHKPAAQLKRDVLQAHKAGFISLKPKKR